MEDQPALVRALKALDALKIPWAVMGSVALAAHGQARESGEMEVQIRVGEREDYEDRLVREMEKARFSRVDENVFAAEEGAIVELCPVSGRLDEDAFRRRVRAPVLDGYPRGIWTVSVEDLVLLKLREYRSWGSPFQSKDVRDLVGSRREVLDVAYLEKQVRRHRLSAVWRRVMGMDESGS